MTGSGLPTLPRGIRVFERGWLSANNVLFADEDSTVLVDSGYWTHQDQTVALVGQALGQRPLDLVLNTHLHSDHCGGNAALQRAHNAVQVWIPPGQAPAVKVWDESALSFQATGQHCPRFTYQGVVRPGGLIRLGGVDWEVHAAPGHDPHSVILFEPSSRTLISADALWRNGFGVVFQELEGVRAFDEVADTLDLIERLQPRVVIPGHGPNFTEVSDALRAARRRLDGFIADPQKHALHAAKVLIKFKLLELQRISSDALEIWARRTPYFSFVHSRYFAQSGQEGQWFTKLVDELVRAGAAARQGTVIINA